MAVRELDYVIVDGGSAKCVLANRSSENQSAWVLLLETRRRDNHPLIHTPVGFAKMTDGPRARGLKTARQKHVNERGIPYAQVRVIGGGISIIAEDLARGHPVDFDRWSTDQSCLEFGIPCCPDGNGPRQAGCGILSDDHAELPVVFRRDRLPPTRPGPHRPVGGNELPGQTYRVNRKPDDRSRVRPGKKPYFSYGGIRSRRDDRLNRNTKHESIREFLEEQGMNSNDKNQGGSLKCSSL